MADQGNESFNDQEEFFSSSGSHGESSDSSLKLILSIANDVKVDTSRNYSALMKMSSGITSLADCQRSFQTEVRAALDNITTALDNLNQGLKIIADPKGPLLKKDKPARRRDAPF